MKERNFIKSCICVIYLLRFLTRCEYVDNCDEYYTKNEYNTKYQYCEPLTSLMFHCYMEYYLSSSYTADTDFIVKQVIVLETEFEVDETNSNLINSTDTNTHNWWCLKIKRGRIKFNDFDGQFASERDKRDTLSFENIDDYDETHFTSPNPDDINFFGLVNAGNFLRYPIKNYTFVIDFHSNVSAGAARIKNTTSCKSNDKYLFSCIDAVESAFLYGTFSRVNNFTDFTDITSESFITTDLYKELQYPTINFFQLVANDIQVDVFFSIYGKPLSILKIETLDLGFHEILYLNEDIVTEMKSLKNFYLDSCRIKNISSGTFYKTPHVEILTLSENELSFMPQVDMLNNLTVLELMNQYVTQFSLTPLQELKSLVYFNISQNNIKNIGRETFKNWNKLKLLDARFCQLQYIESGSLESLHSLKYLNLEGNLLTQIEPKIFYYFDNSVLKIILKNNKLFSNLSLELKNVSLLDISYNLIKTPENLISKGFVDKLDLSYNFVSKWSSETTFESQLHSIKNVNLSHNKITAMKTDSILSTKNLKSIDIGANLLDCRDCSLKEFQTWLKSSKNTEVLNLNSSNQLKCNLPLEQNNVNVIDAKYNETLCILKPIKYGLISGVSISVILLLIAFVGVFLYIYRYEVMYLKHLLRVRKRNATKLERSDCRFDVFVSYCSKDRDWVFNVLLPQLENPQDQYTCCLHERDFPLGSFIVDNIISHITDSRRVLLVLTQNFVNSDWCKWEVQMAQHRIFADKTEFLILLELERLDVSQLPLHLRVLMETRTYLECNDDSIMTSNFWSRLKEALGTSIKSLNQNEEEESLMSEPDYILNEM